MRASRPWWTRSARRFIVGDQANGHTVRLRCILLSWSVVRRPFGIVSQSSLGQRHSRACSLWIYMRQGSCSWLNIALVYRTLTCRHHTIIFVEVGVLVTFAICTFLVQWWLLSLLFRPCHGLRRPDHDDQTTWDAVIRVYRSDKASSSSWSSMMWSSEIVAWSLICWGPRASQIHVLSWRQIDSWVNQKICIVFISLAVVEIRLVVPR